MATVYEGEPDARQTASDTLPAGATLFRARYRQLTDAELLVHDMIKDQADKLACTIGLLNPDVARRLCVNMGDASGALGHRDPANVTLALRHLEDAVYRAVKALTA